MKKTLASVLPAFAGVIIVSGLFHTIRPLQANSEIGREWQDDPTGGGGNSIPIEQLTG